MCNAIFLFKRCLMGQDCACESLCQPEADFMRERDMRVESYCLPVTVKDRKALQ